MSTTLVVNQIQALLNITYTDNLTAATFTHSWANALSVSLANGCGTSQSDIWHVSRQTVTNSSTPINLDLAGGGLTTPNGAAFNPAELTVILVINRSTTADQLVTVGGGSNALACLATGIPIGPNNDFVYLVNRSATGFPVTAGSADILQLSIAGGTNVPVDVVLVGRSAVS